MDMVKLKESVMVDAAAATVFDFVSNGDNDPAWRTEVDRMDIQGPTALGTLLIEYSSFFCFLHTVTPTVITELTPPTRIVLETPDSHPTWLRSVRTVQKHGPQTEFTYELAFELATLKQITPVLPPPALVSVWYSRRIRRYLHNAKRLIETG